jgi:hypothetical protein
MIYRADGYQRYTLYGEKFYVSKTLLYGRFVRYSKRRLKRARDAKDYGIRLVERYARLKAAEIKISVPVETP